MKHFTKTLFLILFLVSGCANQDGPPSSETVWEVSPTFQSDGIQMRGIPHRLAVIDTPFQAGQEQKHMLHFWGKLDEVTGKLTVIAEQKDTGKTVSLLHNSYIIPAVPNNGADNHLPLSVTLPSQGLWRLNVYIGDRFFDSIFVNAE